MIPTSTVRRLAPQHLDRAPVREQQMVRSRERVGVRHAARCVMSPAVPDPRDDPRLVVRDPVRDAVAEPTGNRFDVLGEGVHGVANRPAAGILDHLRRVPVEERHVRHDAVAEQLVDETIVEVEAGVVHGAAPVRDHPRPRDREAERVQTELAHQRDVVAIPVVEVARDRARIAVPHLARCRGEPVPDALAATVFVRRTLDLVRRGRGPPDEVRRERSSELTRHGCPLGCWMTVR